MKLDPAVSGPVRRLPPGKDTDVRYVTWTGQKTGTNRIATAAYKAMTDKPNFQ